MEECLNRTPAQRIRKWVMIAITAVLILLLSAYIFLFHINRFSLSVEIIGAKEIDVEYGATYQEMGADVILRGTLLWKEGIVPEKAVLDIQGTVNNDTKGQYTVTYEASYKTLRVSADRMVRVVIPSAR